jgi:hypothetical protein
VYTLRESDQPVHSLGPTIPPSAWAHWADVLDWSVVQLAVLGVTVPPGEHRLAASARLLRQCAHSEQIPDDAVGIHAVTNASRNALDFVEIAQSLPSKPARETLNELSLALRGTVDQADQDRQPYQQQSALWFGTVLRRAGLNPRVSQSPKRPTTPKSPDYLADNGTMTYGIEVKRPRSWRSLQGQHLPKAVEQFAAANVSGAVAVDVADMLNAVSYEDLPGAVEDLSNRLKGLIFTPDHGYNDGYSRVMVTIVYARGTPRIVLDRARGVRILQVANAVFANAFARAENSLSEMRARWLRDAIRNAMPGPDLTSVDPAGS